MSRLVLYQSNSYSNGTLPAYLDTYLHFLHNSPTLLCGVADARSECTGTVTTEEQSDISPLSRVLGAAKQAVTFLFSHIGLLALVSGYCILGGLTFEHLERENELQVEFRAVNEPPRSSSGTVKTSRTFIAS